MPITNMLVNEIIDGDRDENMLETDGHPKGAEGPVTTQRLGLTPAMN